MKKYFLSIATLVAFTAMAIWAADIDGTWTATTEGKNGPQTQTLTLLSKGGDLTGKLDGGRGPTDISEGKIAGKTVSFKIVREGKNGKQEQEYKGTIDGSDLKLTVTGGRGPTDMVFKKK